MSFFLKSKLLDFTTGGGVTVAVLNEKEGISYGIRAGDKIRLTWSKHKLMTVTAQFTETKVKRGEIGLFEEIWKHHTVDEDDIVQVDIESRPASIEAIKKRFLGKKLTYKEIYSIISDIATGKLGRVETTYFVATGFFKPYTDIELFYMTKAMAETGEMMNLPYEVVDKHCIGGVPANRTTLVMIPIIASLGLYIPNTSSRAITSPSGTSDTMEVLAPVSFSMDEIKNIVKKTHACIVWGGGLSLAPSDDIIIKLSHPLAYEPYDKMLTSIMSKKVAIGVDYLVLDIPIGPYAKVKDKKSAELLAKKFQFLAKKFNMKIKVVFTQAFEPIGRGIGPSLEARDVLRVLQQHKLKPNDLEDNSIKLCADLLELKGFCKKGEGKKIAQKQLTSGKAWEKMNEIIVAQGGKKDILCEEVAVGALHYEIHAEKDGKITDINNPAIKLICVNLGAPEDKLAGMHIHVRHGEKVKKGQKLFTLYASSEDRMQLGIVSTEKNQVLKIQ